MDIVCDVTDPSVPPQSITGRRFALVLCTNLLEHVTDRERVVIAVSDLVAADGYLLVTVPQVYRYHEDPIDTGYRPDMAALATLVLSANPDFQVTSAQTVTALDWRYYRPRRPRQLFLPDIPDLLRYLVPAWRWRQSCVLLRRTIATPLS